MERQIRTVMQEATGQLRVDTSLPEGGASTVWTENFGYFERIGATYTHKIYQGSRAFREGHSKPRNQPEAADKQKLLKDVIGRLARSPKGYLKPGSCIEFYHNRSNYDRDSVKLFTLYTDYYRPEEGVMGWAWLIQFLNHFYTPTTVSYVQDLSGNAPAAPLPTVFAQPVDGNATLNYNKRFKNTAEINEYCQFLLRDGHAPGLVTDYMIKMLDKHNW